MDRKKIAAQRREYEGEVLDPHSVPTDPMDLFSQWFEVAQSVGVEPNAMVLSTLTEDGKPASRVVLLKDLTPDGFTFFTNYDSRKSQELIACPSAALNFFWHETHRQVRIEGDVMRIDTAESDAYFALRPRGSQLGAWASPQSSVVPTRETLDQMFARFEESFEGKAVPRPEHWGGYRLRPRLIEFWQGQPSRLHDRVLYSRVGEAEWTRDRLAP